MTRSSMEDPRAVLELFMGSISKVFNSTPSLLLGKQDLNTSFIRQRTAIHTNKGINPTRTHNLSKH